MPTTLVNKSEGYHWIRLVSGFPGSFQTGNQGNLHVQYKALPIIMLWSRLPGTWPGQVS